MFSDERQSPEWNPFTVNLILFFMVLFIGFFLFFLFFLRIDVRHAFRDVGTCTYTHVSVVTFNFLSKDMTISEPLDRDIKGLGYSRLPGELVQYLIPILLCPPFGQRIPYGDQVDYYGAFL